MTDDVGLDSDASATRRRSLLGMKLRALVRAHTGDGAVDDAIDFAPGAAVLHDGTAWAYLDDRPAERLGAAIAWWLRSDAAALAVVAEEGTGTIARRAAEFDAPITVWHADDHELWPAVAEPLPEFASPPATHHAFEALMRDCGVTPVVEHGVLSGELAGLEVCRVVDDPHTGAVRLEVGVGVHDREAFAMIHGDVPSRDALAGVVAAVAEHRRLDAPPHPLNRLARERLLRSVLVSDPTLVGLAFLAVAPPPVPRRNLKDPVPCSAHGVDPTGTSVTVVCSVGVDLDLIPYAADARLAHAAPGVGAGDGRLLVVTPERDRLGVTAELAARLRQPAELVSFG